MPLTRKLASKSLIKQNTNQDVIGTGVTNLVRDAFTGTGSQTVFTLSIAPLSAANTQVFISGVYQNKNTYTISGTTLTFSTPPPNATNIEVISGTNYSIGVPGDGAVSNVKLANAPANTIKANNTGSAAAPTDITIPQLAAMFTTPTVQRFTSGSGTYNAPANVKYIRVKMVGGGGAGASTVFGSNANGGAAGAYYEFILGNPTSYSYSVGTGGATAGAAGAATTFGSNSAGGGAGGPAGFAPAAGGSCSGSLGITIVQVNGGNGGIADSASGGAGGVSVFSGGGAPNGGAGPVSAPANSGAGGSANTGLGGSGVIIVEEYYQ